ncbi:type 4a pilus biogenesis protein PilO [Oleiharenicola lentus]|uniref:type 4a pilus biogenesis protein PilO n=1 Tax=Oleiharenicola lentus TaxID=2508720 RepID=UPI003F667242
MTSADLVATLKKHPLGFLCGLIAIVCLFWIFYFRSGENDTLQSEYDTKSMQASKMVTNVRNADKLSQQLAEMQAMTKELDSRLINSSQLAVNLQYFYRLEAETGVKFNDVRQNTPPKTAKAGLSYVGIPYFVSVQGSYQQVMLFIKKLESGPHFAHFISLNFAKTSQGSESSQTDSSKAMVVSINLELLGKP